MTQKNLNITNRNPPPISTLPTRSDGQLEMQQHNYDTED